MRLWADRTRGHVLEMNDTSVFEEAITVQVRDYQTPPAAPAPVAAPPAAPTRPWSPPPPPPKPHSRLGWLVLSVATIGLGVLGLVDLAGTSVPGSAYVALPLAVLGLGLVAGAWYGRARWLIALGAVLTVVLGIASAVERVDAAGQSVTWRPTSVEQVDATYTIELGSAVLDLSAVDFSGRSEAVQIRVGVGDLRVIVPPTVDVRATARVDVGNATLFGTSWGGIGQSERTVTDNGVDGPGGGELVIEATVDVGDVEVQR